MLQFILSRLALTLPVLLLVSILSFVLLRLAPGDAAVLQAGLGASPEAIEAIRQQLHLDRPLALQYLYWLGNLLRGDLGESYGSGQAVTDLILQRLPATAQLAFSALLLIIVVGVPLGIWSALRVNNFADQAIRALSLVGVSVPNFVIGIFLVLVFGWWFPNILPYQGFVPFSSQPVASLAHTILPALALSAPQIGLIARLTRSSMLEVLAQDYILAARSMGVPEYEIIWKDALRNALLPVVTVLGVICGFLLGGSVVIESVFGIAGIGRLLVDSFASRDYPVTIGVMMFIAAVFVVVSLMVDVLYGIINPRIKLGYETGRR